VSVIDAAHEALRHARRHLFPVHPLRWLTLGFVAFLDQCGRGTGLGGGGVPGAGDTFDPRPLLRWAVANPLPAALVGAIALLVIVLALALILWLNSRGSFAYADLVANGASELGPPWRGHRAEAHSYFLVRFGLVAATAGGLIGLALALAAAALGLAGLRRPQPANVLIGFGVLFLMLVFAVLMSVLSVLLRDFVVPLQMEARAPCWPAVRVLQGLVLAHPGAFVLYVVLKIAFTLVLAAAMLLVCCGTCAIGLLPVIGQTVLQPAYYFERGWSLFLLRQMGHSVFPAAAAPDVPFGGGEGGSDVVG
jgi:hypothetical protein